MNVAVVGAGSWGTALALHLARAGCSVALWAREAEVVAGIRERRSNPLFLSEFTIPAGVRATGDLAEAGRGADAVVLVVPVQFARAVLRELRPHLGPGALRRFGQQGDRGVEPGPHGRAGERGARARSGGVRGALGTVVRPRGGGRPADRRRARRPRPGAVGRRCNGRSPPARFASTPRPTSSGWSSRAPSRTSSRSPPGMAEGLGLGQNAHGGAAHPRPARDRAPGRAARRARGDVPRPGRDGRPGAHLLAGEHVAQPERRRAPRPRRDARRHPRRPRGRRGRPDDPRRRRARAPPRRRDADHLHRRGDPRRRARAARGGGRR